MSDNYYENIDPEGQLMCRRCKVALVRRPANFEYMGNAFPVQLPTCPVCHFVFVPEELAVGRVTQVEHSLEDK